MNSRYASLVLLLLAAGCKLHGGGHVLPPAAMMMHPGPGVDGPGPGVISPMEMSGGAVGVIGGSSQVAFLGPEGMQVQWDAMTPGSFDSEPLVTPGRQNFPQAAIYRLKLTNIPGRPGTELYPTLEIAPSMPRSEAYLAHNAIPVRFTEEDLDQVDSGNFVTKVLYLPDGEYQELAVPGVETLVSTQLLPGEDPIVEADKRGSILAIVRLGNKDLALPGTDGSFGGLSGLGGGMPAGYMGPGGPGCGPDGMGGMGGVGGMGVAPGTPPAFLSGVSTPEWGMPYVGTPIGLPGPPHVPLGGPAGLNKHVMKNHTRQHLPRPVNTMHINVKQSPGFSYPAPVNSVWIHEKAMSPGVNYRQPKDDRHQCVE